MQSTRASLAMTRRKYTTAYRNESKPVRTQKSRREGSAVAVGVVVCARLACICRRRVAVSCLLGLPPHPPLTTQKNTTPNVVLGSLLTAGIVHQHPRRRSRQLPGMCHPHRRTIIPRTLTSGLANLTFLREPLHLPSPNPIPPQKLSLRFAFCGVHSQNS